MIEIKHNALYTRADLAEMLEGYGVDVDTFIGRIRPRKVFKCLFFGEDILQALRSAPALDERKRKALPAAGNRGGGKRRRSPLDTQMEPFERIDNHESG